MNHSNHFSDPAYQDFLKAPAILRQLGSDKVELFDTRDDNALVQSPVLADSLIFGKRMEQYFSHYIRHSKNYELIAENLQVIDGGHTIGELDFLIRDLPANQVYHVEMACKFYLLSADSEANGRWRWTGPNRRDFLDLKLDKLLHKQFPLLHRKETRPYLERLGLEPNQIHQKLCLKGLLFMPLNKAPKIDAKINPDCLRGEWCSHDQFRSISFKSHRYHLPAKENWLAYPAQNNNWSHLEQVQANLLQRISEKKSSMVWLQSPEGKTRRLFITWWKPPGRYPPNK